MKPNNQYNQDLFNEALLNSISDCIIATDLEGKIIYWNKAAEELYKWKSGEVVGENITEITPSNLTKEQALGIMDSLKKGDSWEGEFEVQDKNGKTFPVYVKDSPLVDDKGNLIGIIGSSRIIPKQFKSWKIAKENEEKYKLLFENMGQGHALHELVYDKSGKAVDYNTLLVNEKYEELLNVSRDSVIGKKASEFLPEEELNKWLEIFGEVAITGNSKEYSFYSDHNKKFFEGMAYCPEKGKFAVSFSDVTKQRQAEEETRLQQLNQIFLNSLTIPLLKIHTVDEFSEILLKRLKEHTGAVLATFSYYEPVKKVLQLLHVETEKGILNTIIKVAGEKITRTATPVDEQTYQMIIKDTVASYRSFVEVTFGAIPDMIDKAIRKSTGIDRIIPIAHVIEGELYGTSMIAFKKGQATPTTELLESYAHLLSVSLRRYNAEKALHDSETKYRLYVENSPLGIMVVDDEGKYIDVNPGACKLLGYTQNELLHLSIPDVLADKKEISSFQKLKEKGKLNYELKLKKKDETFIDVRVDAVLLPNNQLMAFHADITERKKTVKALEESENKYKNLFNSMQEGVYLHQIVYDDNGNAINYRITEANDISEKILNIKKEAAIGQLATDLFGTKEAPFLEIYSKVAETGVPYTFDQYFEPINKHFSISAFSPRKGEFATVFADVTQQKKNEQELIKAKEKAEKSELRFKAISEQAMDGIALTNLEGKYIFVNTSFCKMMGYSKRELLKMKVFDLRATDANDSLFHGIKEGKQKGKAARTKLVRKDKSIIYVDINGSFLDLGHKHYIMGIHRDVTELMNYENELLRAKEKAEESDRLKSAFLANMSHEIRTPMNGIFGFTNLLKEPDLTGEQQQQFIEIIQKSGNRMLNTVNDIIEISRIEAGEMRTSSNKVNIRKHLLTLYNFFSLEAEKKGLELIIDNKLPGDNSVIVTDKNKLSSVLTNLIKNAIKFTDRGSIKIGCKQNKEFLEFYVEDNGIGIPADRIDAVFNRFEQADIKDSRVYEGSGLGLAIAKSYVEMLGGKIWIESEENKGSTFFFTIPYESPAKKEGNSNANHKTQPQQRVKLNILVVEDDETSSFYLSTILKDLSGTLKIISNGLEAVNYCKNNSDVDLILMDIKMPGLNGYETTKRIREFNKDVIIIAQTAYAIAGDRESAIEAGCNDHISKPIKKEKLMEKIRICFNL